METRRSSGRVLSYVATAVVLALVGANILAGERGIGASSEDNVSARGGDRPPRFVVVLELEQAGITGYFTGVSGLGSTSEVIEFRDGSDPNVVHKLPGRLKWEPITLKRGITTDRSLWQWRQMVESGNIADARTNGKLTLLDRGNPIATWHFVNAWPSKISGPGLNGEGKEIAIETLVIVHEGMSRES